MLFPSFSPSPPSHLPTFLILEPRSIRILELRRSIRERYLGSGGGGGGGNGGGGSGRDARLTENLVDDEVDEVDDKEWERRQYSSERRAESTDERADSMDSGTSSQRQMKSALASLRVLLLRLALYVARREERNRT